MWCETYSTNMLICSKSAFLISLLLHSTCAPTYPLLTQSFCHTNQNSPVPDTCIRELHSWWTGMKTSKVRQHRWAHKAGSPKRSHQAQRGWVTTWHRNFKLLYKKKKLISRRGLMYFEWPFQKCSREKIRLLSTCQWLTNVRVYIILETAQCSHAASQTSFGLTFLNFLPKYDPVPL